MSEQAGNGQRRVGFLGKLPEQPDFVRQPIAERIGQELDQWLVKSVQSLHLVKQELPDACVRFVFSAPGCEAVAVGVMRKSQDQVGRSFPLAIYTWLALDSAAQALQAIALAHGAFLARAEELLAALPGLSLQALRVQAAELEQVPSAPLGLAVQRCAEVLAQTAPDAMFARVFAQSPQEGHLYGLYTLRTATSAVRGAPAASAPTVLDCPITNDVDLIAWLDLTRRCLGWAHHAPSFVWIEEPDPRLLLALGHASDQLLGFVADPHHRSARLWPLWTDRADAVQLAREGLALPLPLPPSLDALWALLASSAR